MIEPVLKVISRPDLEHPIFIAGLTGFGAVGKISADLLIKSSKAKLFAELYSPYLPDYVIISENGIVRLPKYSFYYSKNLEKDIIILTCDTQPPADSLKTHYQMCGIALNLAEEYKCGFVITMGGFPTPETTKDVFIAATEQELIERFVTERTGIYKKGRIIGATGLLLGLAKVRGMKGISVLGVTSGIAEDHKAAFSVFRFVTQLIGKL